MPDQTFGPYKHLTFRVSTSPSGDGAIVVDPTGDFKISREPGTDDAFFFRDKLSGPLTFREADYRLLMGVEQSADRCQDLYLLLDIRSYEGGPLVYTWVGTFTCNECEFIPSLCQVRVTPVPYDGYQQLFEAWEREINLLDCPATRTTVTAQLATLPTGQQLEWTRSDAKEYTTLVGTAGWAVFLKNNSHITGKTRDETVLLFRYRRRNEPMVVSPITNLYEPRDLSEGGWQFLDRDDTALTAEYVKEPEISGFKSYQIGTFDDWYHIEGGRNPRYGTQLLLLSCGQQPSSVGLSNEGYIEVTGTGGAFNQETEPCLNVRRSTNTNNSKSLWWKFGQFTFSGCFPLLDGLYHLLQQTAPFLLPPRPTDLSSFFTWPTNPVTAATGTGNELPGLLIAAGSDLKRFFGSEPATRLMISFKQALEDACTLWDLGYYIDPLTGWFRLEHRSWFESQAASIALDLTPAGEFARVAILPGSYTYRNEKLPKYEQLQVSAAVTEDFGQGVSFGKGEIQYDGACVNSREGQNTATRTVSRLTGDVAGLVLSGDALPDSCIAVLNVNADGSVRDGNRLVAASELLRRYHRHGRSQPTGLVNGRSLFFASLKLLREEAGISVTLCSLAHITPSTKIRTLISHNARPAKAEISLATGVVTLTAWHPGAEGTGISPLTRARSFNDSFNKSMK